MVSGRVTQCLQVTDAFMLLSADSRLTRTESADDTWGSSFADVVLAANVLHATQSVHTSLQHALSLLRPGGVLVLLEVLAMRRMLFCLWMLPSLCKLYT